MATTVATPSFNAVSGVLSELASLGQQETLSYCDPDASLWVQSWARVTNYGIAEHDICFNSAPTGAWAAQQCLKATLTNTGDLLQSVAFKCRLSGLVQVDGGANVTLNRLWTPGVGWAMLSNVKLIAGQQTMEEFGTEYMVCKDELYCAEGKRAGLAVGDYGPYLRSVASDDANGGVRGDQDTYEKGLEFSSRSQDIYVQLPFHFSDHPGSAFNMIGLQQHNLDIEIAMRSRDDVVLQFNATHTTGAIVPVATPLIDANGGLIDNVGLRATFVHLDKKERLMRARMPSTVYFTYPQTQSVSIVASDANTRKEFRSYAQHPVIDVMVCYRAAERTATTYFKRWCEFGAYRAQRPIACKRAVLVCVKEHEVFDAIARIDMEVNSHTRISTFTNYLRRALPASRSAARVPSRIVHHYAFAYDPMDREGPRGSFNLSRIDNIVYALHFRQAHSGAGLPFVANAEHIVERSEAGAAGGTALVDTGSTAGTVFVFKSTMNYYKQQGGMIGTLFA